MAAARARDPWPPDVLAELERSLSGELARAYVLRGEERFFRERAIAAIVARAAARGDELCRHDGSDPELSLSALLDDLSGAPMFAAARCVVVREPEAADLLAKRGDGSPSSFTRTALAFLEDAGRAGCLVISSRSLRADHALAKGAQRAGGALFTFRKLWESAPPWKPHAPAELALYVQARARELGVRLSQEEAGYVAAATGNDLAALETQLEKLRHGRGSGAALREIVGWDSSGGPWMLAEPFLRGDLPRVLAGLQALYASGFESGGKRELDPAALANVLVGSLRNLLRQTIAGARARAAGEAPAAAAAAAGLKGSKPALDAFEARLDVRPAAEWERMLEELGELERRTRTGAMVDQSDFVQLALRWSLARPAPRPRSPARNR